MPSLHQDMLLMGKMVCRMKQNYCMNKELLKLVPQIVWKNFRNILKRHLKML